MIKVWGICDREKILVYLKHDSLRVVWWDEALASTDLSSSPLSKSESPVQGSVRKFPHSGESEIDLRLGRQSILKRPSTQRSAQFLRECSKCRISSAINSAHSSVAEGFSAIPRALSNRTWCLWIDQELRERSNSGSASRAPQQPLASRPSIGQINCSQSFGSSAINPPIPDATRSH